MANKNVEFFDATDVLLPSEVITEIVKPYLPEDRDVDPVLLYGRRYTEGYRGLQDADKVSALNEKIKNASRIIVYGKGALSEELQDSFDVRVWIDVTPRTAVLNCKNGKNRNIGLTEELPYALMMRRNYYVDFETGTGLMEHKLPSLYGVSLRAIIENKFPDVKLFFIHDSTAFIFGALENKPNLREKNISGVMLGTGLGYIHCVKGKVEVNEGKTPLHPLWNTPYKNGIAENYVSATAMINKSREKGYSFDNVKDIEIAAKQGDDKLLSVFYETGTQLGELIEIKRKEDKFEELIIGGQVSKGWGLMQKGFEEVCNIPYELVDEPAKCPLFGIKYCAEKGIESIYKDGE